MRWVILLLACGLALAAPVGAILFGALQDWETAGIYVIPVLPVSIIAATLSYAVATKQLDV